MKHTATTTALAAATAAATTALTLAGCSQAEPASTEASASDITTAPSAATVLAANSKATIVDDYDTSDAVDAPSTIDSAGTYRVHGEVGGITIDAGEDASVVLLLDDATITNPTGPAINIVSADDVALVLAGTNAVSDAESYGEDEPNAAIYSKADLTIAGEGSLTVTGKGGDGIATSDDLAVIGGNLDITAADDGLRGKDSLTITDATVTINAGGDALKSNGDDTGEDLTQGWVHLGLGAHVTATAGSDGVDAATDAVFDGGEATITATKKGVKAGVFLILEGSALTVDAEDDGLHSDGAVGLHSGTATISSGDDGVHAEVALVADGANVAVTDSVEAFEGGLITIAGGVVNLTASDDGINGSGPVTEAQAAEEAAAASAQATQTETPSTDAAASPAANPFAGLEPGERPDPDDLPEGFTMPTDMPAMPTEMPTGMPDPSQLPEGFTPPEGGPGGGMGAGGMEDTGEQITISGGILTVTAEGDGIDSNGDVHITGGNTTVYGPTVAMNGALDANGEITISGGTLAAIGSKGMAEAPESGSGQGWLQADISGGLDQQITITDASGREIASYLGTKDFGNIVYSSDQITTGEVYTVTAGETSVEVTAGEATAGGMMQPGRMPGARQPDVQ